MNKKIISGLTALPLMLASSMALADSGGGTINFSGTIITAPCNIVLTSAEQAVSFPEISNTYLNEGGMSDELPISIKLTGCSDTVSQSVNVTFDTTTPAGTSASQIAAGSTNAAIEILGDDGLPVDMKVAIDKGAVTDGDMSLDFTTRLVIATDAAPGSVTEGTFTATATFELTYA